MNWDTDFALGLAKRIDLAITLSPRLYAKDVEIALKIITTLFDYESQQNSSTLVSARTNEFAKVHSNYFYQPAYSLYSFLHVSYDAGRENLSNRGVGVLTNHLHQWL